MIRGMETEILLFLWRWKMASSSALAAKFCPSMTASGANKLLERLRREKLIHSHYINAHNAKSVWMPSKKGFELISDHLPALREEGFRSEHIYHDFLVTCVHLGDWLLDPSKGTESFSEQELRRADFTYYPSWVPATDLHRPDGYWRVKYPQGSAVLALEVELKIKSLSSYRYLGKFYRDQPGIFRVVWIVRSLAGAKTIHRTLAETSPENADIHHFILLSDFLSSGWQARLHIGSEKHWTLAELLGQRSGKYGEMFPAYFLLDTRKFPFSSKPYSASKKRHRSPLGMGTPIPTQPYPNPNAPISVLAPHALHPNFNPTNTGSKT